MSAGVRLDETGKPIFNQFGLPIVCDTTDTPGGDNCCAPCEALNQCLRRVPLKLTTPGLRVHDWLEVLPGDATATNRTGNGITLQSAEGDTDTLFAGTWLLYPLIGSGWPDEPWPGLVYNGLIISGLDLDQGTAWQSAAYRTLLLADGTKSQVRLFAYAQCVDDAGTPSIQFTVYLRIVAAHVSCLTLGALDEHILWPVFQSAPIALDGLALSELVNVDCPTYVDPTPATRLFEDVVSGFGAAATCPGPVGGDCDGVCWWLDSTDYDDAPYPISLTDELGGSNLLSLLSFSCARTDPEDGGEQCDTVVELTTGATPVRTTETIDFEYTPSGCYKRFTAIYPPALDYCWNGEEYVYQPPEFYWSFGQTGSSVLHRIDGPPDSDIGASETVTMTMFVCDAVCSYTVIKEVDCSCLCTGTGTPPSMSLAYVLHEVTPPEFGVPCTDYPDAQFTYRLTVTGAADPDCDSEFMEVQISSEGPWSVLSCCPCPVGRDDPDGTACTEEELEAVAAFAYTNGQTIDFSIGLDEPACVRYRTWDSCCGCPGPWSYALFYVECEVSAPAPDEWCPWL